MSTKSNQSKEFYKKNKSSRKEEPNYSLAVDAIIAGQRQLRHYDAVCLLLNNYDDCDIIRMVELKQREVLINILQLVSVHPRSEMFLDKPYIKHLLQVLS